METSNNITIHYHQGGGKVYVNEDFPAFVIVYEHFLSPEEFRFFADKAVSLYEQIQAHYGFLPIISDLRGAEILALEDMEWFYVTIAKRYLARGKLRMALIQSSELIGQLAAEEYIQCGKILQEYIMENRLDARQKLVNNTEEAYAWLRKQLQSA